MIFSTTDTVTATLYYYVSPADGSAPYVKLNADPTAGERQRNWEQVPREVQIENIRGKEDTVTLDTTGFQFFRRPAQYKTFENDEVIKKEYYPEQIELIKELTGASRAVIFDHTIRRRRPDESGSSPEKRQPVTIVHIDQTPESSAARVKRHMPPEDVPKLLAGRYQIINLWRPISNPAYDWPLALCDYRSVDRENDPVSTVLYYSDSNYNGLTYNVKFNPDHKWKYLRGMEPDEFVLIKCYDSKDDGLTALYTPHTAFVDPSTPENAPFRESIELRFLVFYD